MMTPFRDRIAYGSIGWVTWPLSEIATKLAAIGIRGIEGFGVTEMMPEDTDLQSVLARLNVRFVGSYFGASLVQKDRRETEVHNFTATVRKVAELGGTIIALGGGRVYPEITEEEKVRHWDNLIDGVHQFGSIARKHGVQLAFHPHDHTRVFRAGDIKRFLKDSDPGLVGLTFDTAHIAAAGMDILDAWEEFRSRVVHLHLKDLKDGAFTEIEGHLPLAQFLKSLQGSNYTGWLTIELDATPDPEASARKSWKQVLQWIA